jgi:hypothetical protein
MITLAQLEAEFTAEVLLEVTSKLGLDLQNEYDPDSAELSAIRAEAEKFTSTSTSDASKPSGSAQKASPEVGNEVRKSQQLAIDKSQEQQKQSQGAMVAGQKEAVQAILQAEKKTAVQVGNLANRIFATTLLTVRSKGFERFAQSYTQSSQLLAEVTDQVYLLDAESEENFLKELDINGDFTLELEADPNGLELLEAEVTDPFALDEADPNGLELLILESDAIECTPV